MAKKIVTLRIINKQYSESLQPRGETYVRELKLEDSFEVMTEGTLYTKNGATYITYDESEKAGLEDNRTMIKVEDSTMSIRRFGSERAQAMNIQLEEGVRNITRYKIPMAVFDLEVYTNSLGNSLDEEGYGEIHADYNIKLETLMNRRNKLTIEVLRS